MSENVKRADVKKAQDEKFEWISRNHKGYHKAKTDISINCITYDKKPYNGLSFSFRNDVWQFFGDRVEIAVYKNRILFRTAQNGEGIQLCKGSVTTPNRYFKLRVDENTQIIKDKFIGDYELKYDSFYELYYIEKEDAEV